MPVLGNPKHELFAQELAKGRTATEAYVTAGYKRDDGNASKLAAKPAVQARVQEITGAAAEKAGVTAERVIAELAKIGFADIRQVVSWRPEETIREPQDGDDGEVPGKVVVSRVTVIDSATLSDDTAAAIAEVSQGVNGTLRIKMHDKPGALEKLGRTLGIFKDKVEMTGKDGAPLTPTLILTGRPEPAPAPKTMGGARKRGD